MRSMIAVWFGFISVGVFGQNSQAVNLNWKIAPNEKLSYLTVMSEVDSSELKMNFGPLFNFLSDSTAKGVNEANNFFKGLNQSLKDFDFVSTLSNKGNNIIDIVMTTRPKKSIKAEQKDTIEKEEKGLLRMMSDMNDGIMLRGSVYASGGIHSFWVKSSQKNLISTFFELPSKSVRIGDTWQLDINLIGNDQNFECDSSYKLNKVTLTDIKKINGESVAFLKYDIVEYVKGNFNSPSLINGGGQVETIMKFTHQAIGVFSIDKGRWVSYNGIMSFDASGIMKAKKKTKFSLVPE